MRKKLSFYTAILTYFLIVFGGYVASSESGMGCGPEWPLCNGEVIPELHGDTLIEFGHRVIGAVIFMLTVILFVIIKKENSLAIKAKKAADWMLALLIFQLIAGAIVVFYHLPSIIITIHLLIAMVFLGILIWYWRYDDRRSIKNGVPIIKHLNVLIIVLLATIVVGAYVKHEYYGLACGWFTCGDSFMPTTLPGFIQTFHRVLAFISVLYMALITYKVFKIKNDILMHRLSLAILVILAQAIIGIMTILTSISLSFAVWHLAAATLVFAIIVEARVMILK